jgi:hypothetical protein
LPSDILSDLSDINVLLCCHCPLLSLGRIAQTAEVETSVSASKRSGKVIRARHADIGLDKVSPLKQQRLVYRFGQCISETIAEIQPGPMPSPPEVVVGLARQSALL